MVNVKDDLTGMVFGRLTVVRQTDDYLHPNGSRRAQWLCECSCAEHKLVVVCGDRLKAKNGTRSCGCLQKESLQPIHNSKRKMNTYNLSGVYGVGWTTNTNKEFYFDLEDYDKIKDYCWHEEIMECGYHALVTRERLSNTNIRMHWLILGKHLDHINRNPLDNRKENLRSATDEENARNRNIRSDNTSGIVGVTWNHSRKKWIARISNNKERIYLGAFDNKSDAIVARLNAESMYYCEFAPQRHLFEKYGITYTGGKDHNE